MIYLDYNATSPLRPEVKQAMIDVMDLPHNPSSIHASGRAARKLVEDSRKEILESVNAKSLVFCGSATEANSLALAQADNYVISSIEHDSIYKVASNPVVIGVDSNGIVKLDELEEKLSRLNSPKSLLLSVMLANNESGVMQPVKQIAELGHKYGLMVHTDAVQAWGKIEIDFTDLGVDLMTISAHKIGGPVGAAALVAKPNIELKPFLKGGGQEKNKRAGTENIPAIVGFAKSSAKSSDISVSHETAKLQNYLESEIKKISPDAVIHGEKAPRLPNTSLISMPNVEAATQLIAFDMAGVCVSSGSACSSGKVEISRVLKMMDAPLLKNAIRISTGWATTKNEIDRFFEEWKKIFNSSL